MRKGKNTVCTSAQICHTRTIEETNANVHKDSNEHKLRDGSMTTVIWEQGRPPSRISRHRPCRRPRWLCPYHAKSPHRHHTPLTTLMDQVDAKYVRRFRSFSGVLVIVKACRPWHMAVRHTPTQQVPRQLTRYIFISHVIKDTNAPVFHCHTHINTSARSAFEKGPGHCDCPRR